MKLLCPKCSSECDVSGQGQSTLACPSCGLALFVSTSIRGRLSSTRMGQVDQEPEALDRDGNRLSPLPQTVNFVGEVSRQAPEMALVPQFLGRYEIVEFLGAGSFSRVYLAKDSQLGRLVALKVPKLSGAEDKRSLNRFYQEVRAAAALRTLVGQGGNLIPIRVLRACRLLGPRSIDPTASSYSTKR